jgi:SAM-dependent methyltransferase
MRSETQEKHDDQGRCPICGDAGHEKLFPEYRGPCITSQMFFCPDIELDNRCCTSCGFIFNNKGIRGIEEEIYSNVVWKPKPQVLSFSKNAKTSHQRALEVFQALVDIPKEGRLLDFGAGTGAFLREFTKAYPDWKLTALEPGDGYKQLQEGISLEASYNQPYYQLDLDQRFDMVIVMSVLEHVADPLNALAWIHERLKPDGLLLMQHPDFAKLPGDLFCADHINKMTIPYTRKLCEHAGFSFLSENSEMLPFYFAFSRTEQKQPLPDCFDENMGIAGESEHIARRTVDAVKKAVASAVSKNRKAAVFGTSPIGSMAHLVLDCKDDVACFVDENQNAWGWEIDGLPVVGPAEMEKYGVSDLALAISPLYWEKVAEKMSGYGVEVHVPEV